MGVIKSLTDGNPIIYHFWYNCLITYFGFKDFDNLLTVDNILSKR